MARNFIRIIEDIEEALSREVRRMVFFERRQRGNPGVTFREMFDPFTGEFVRKPIEPRFFDDTADSLISTSPRFTLELLKLYEDLETSRLVPAIGNECVEALSSPGAYATLFGGNDLLTTNGGTSSTVTLNNRKIRSLTTDHWLRILSGENQGTYRIDSISLVGNGPHTLTLSNDLLTDLPTFKYNPASGILAFDTTVDLTAVKAGDALEDIAANSIIITAVNASDSSLAVAPGSILVSGQGAKITRSGDVLQGDDSGDVQYYLILDPSQPVSGKSTTYRKRSYPIPYTFVYFVKISSRERDDHNAIANRMMQVFNPARGTLPTIVRSDESFESETIKGILAGDTTIFVEDATHFYVNEKVRLFDNLDLGEELTIESVNVASNTVTFTTPVTKTYVYDNCPRLVSNYQLCYFERDFRNHITENKQSEQFWIHRFTYRIEGWIDSRIPDYSTEQTFEDVGDVNFVEYVMEDMEGNERSDPLIP